jgi:AraC-like DNA-binding protein
VYRRTRRFATTFPDFSEVSQTTRDRLRVEATCIDFAGMSLHRSLFSAGFQFRANVAPGSAVLALTEGQAALTSHGRPWPASAFALAGTGGIDAFSLSPACVVWIEFPANRQSFAEGLRAALASDRGEFFVSDEAATVRLRRAARQGSADLRGALDGVLAGAERLAQRVAVVRRYQLVLEAEDFMAKHFGEVPHLDSLGAELGCSARTLIYAFTQVFGIGPMAYFKLQRLNAIHRLLSAGDGALKISELAPRYGFRHMGHFSTDYRLMFGRPPSHSRFARERPGSSHPG